MQTFQTETGAILYHDHGDATQPAIVFSNSLGTDHRVWDRLTPLLPDGLRTIRYDKRGHGLSDEARPGWTIADHANDLAGLLDHLGVANAVVCGLSVGGMIAQALASSRPDLTRAIVLMCTAAKIGDPEMWRTRVDAIEKNGLASLGDAILERWFTAEFRAQAPDMALWRNMLLRTPASGYCAVCKAIASADLTAATQALTLPTLAIAGSDDGSTPPDLVRATADLVGGATFQIIDQAGHLPCIERPAATAEAINGFMQSLD